MEKATQNYRVIQPVHTSGEPAQTFVHSFATQNSDPNNTDNLYFVFTIWAPSSDIPQISKQTTEVFTENFFQSVDHRAREERFKLALKSVNEGIQELNHYYKQKDERFHIEAAILAIYNNDLLLTTSGDTHIYRKSSNQYTSLTNSKHHSSYQNMFETVLEGKAQTGDKLILASARFSDRLPRSILYEYLQSDTTHTFDNFEQKIHSLKNHQLGIVEISFEPILTKEDDTIPVQTKQKVSKSKTDSFQKALKSVLGGITALFRKMSKGNFIRTLKGGFKSFWNNLFSKYINPNPLIPLVIIGVIAIIILSTIGYFVWYNPHNQTLKKTFATIEQNVQKAQSQAANNQKADALQTLNSTKKIIASISPSDQSTLNSIEQKDKKPTLNDIQNTINSLEDKLQSIERVSGTAVYTNPQSSAIYSAISDLGDSVYAINQTTGEITVSLKNGTSSKSLGINSELKGVLSLSSSTTSNSLFALTSDSVYQIKTDGTITKQTIVGTLPSSVAIAAYLQNVYLLSPSDNQIYRFAKSSAGLGARNPYIKKPSTNLLADATSLSVNGNVFVSLRNGDVLLFDQGVQKDFQITGKPVDDQDIAQLAYSNSPEQLIQLNPIKKAFIITSLRDGGGEFTKEIIVNTTSEVSSFVYDSKTKSVFFTSDNTIQKFTLE